MRIPVTVLLLAAAACYDSTGPGADLRTADVTIDNAFQLHVGERAFVTQAGLYVRFLEVVSDSRCPSNALILCVWEGEAVIAVAIELPDSAVVVDTLYTRSRPSAVDVGAWVLHFLDLAPYPEDVEPIPVEQYVATLEVRRHP